MIYSFYDHRHHHHHRWTHRWTVSIWRNHSWASPGRSPTSWRPSAWPNACLLFKKKKKTYSWDGQGVWGVAELDDWDLRNQSKFSPNHSKSPKLIQLIIQNHLELIQNHGPNDLEPEGLHLGRERHLERYPIWVEGAKLTSCLEHVSRMYWWHQAHLFLKQPASFFSCAAGDAGSCSEYTCHPLLRQHTFLMTKKCGPTNLVMVHTFELLLYIHHPRQELLRTSPTAHASSFGETQCIPHRRCTSSDGSLWHLGSVVPFINLRDHPSQA